MAIPLAERERRVEALVDELCAVLPLARDVVRARVRLYTREMESLHEFWRAKGGPRVGRPVNQHGRV